MRNWFWKVLSRYGSILEAKACRISFQSCLNWWLPILPFFIPNQTTQTISKVTMNTPSQESLQQRITIPSISFGGVQTPGLGSPSMNKTPNCSVVEFLSNLIPCFTISSQSITDYVWLCLLQKVNWGGKVWLGQEL